MVRKFFFILLALISSFSFSQAKPPVSPRIVEDFNKDWKFSLANEKDSESPAFDDSQWRKLNLPHDWSIEGSFSKDHPSGIGGGALPGGVGWYRKTFVLPASEKDKNVFIDFDGVYHNSEVYINGKLLGKRPFGYNSFRYDLTPYLHGKGMQNVIAVKVDNSRQPNSRWYSGSGIYRNVKLTITDNIFVDLWGTFITTTEVTEKSASITIQTTIRSASAKGHPIKLTTILLNAEGKEVSRISSEDISGKLTEFNQTLKVDEPSLWSIEQPYLYKAVSQVERYGKVIDRYETFFGIRYFKFDRDKGFFLNGKSLKIKGVCNHHDLGCLGAALNYRALERQLEIMKAMGVNGIRTSHNPPAPELLELCDKMGFIVMDEAFDMWKKKKTDHDYHLAWDEWHKKDLEDLIRRDRNHPSIFIWSIGNEVSEQWATDSSAATITKELAAIVRSLDKTRPITAACNEVTEKNGVLSSGALDLIGTNYSHEKISKLPAMFPGHAFIGTETTSALMTRGSYDMPSDSIRLWPTRWDLPLLDGNKDNSCSSYDNCRTPWGSSHEDSWKLVKKYDFFSGMYIWTGFDYIGEPTPYQWPSRSSYFGIVDLAGFPKDVYYMYQSEWTDQPVLHIFPHWNWKPGQVIDVWAYYNKADEVELFLNGKSVGIKKKTDDTLHVYWRLSYEPGELKAISRLKGKEVMTKVITTTGAPAKIILEADRSKIKADGKDLSFVTVKVVDKEGRVVPYADNNINFSLAGNAEIAGLDNGDPTSPESFQGKSRKAFHGLCLAVIRSKEKSGQVKLTAASEGLEPATISIILK